VRILDVSPRVVFPPMRGSSVRTHNLLRHLARSHDVRLFAQPRLGHRPAEPPPYGEHLHESGLARALCSASERAWVSAPILSGAGLRLARPAVLRELLGWADVVLVEFPWQFEHCRRERPSAPLVLSAINVEAAKFASWAEAAGTRLTRRPWLRWIERTEAAAVRHAALITVVSERDRRDLAARYELDPDRVVVVPNGADADAYRPVDPERRAAAKLELGLPDRPAVLFAAADMPANRRGLRWVEQAAALADRFTFVVVGTVAKRRPARANLVVAGPVPDIQPWLEAADLAICPIEHGGGTKIKLLEALAAGLPTVAFPHAVEGLTVRDGREILVVPPDERAVVSALERLVADPELARSVAAGGREFVVTGHDWADGAARLEAALLGLVDGAAP
jgi:glycosyltransferase involved in cell wall biosynthesis